MLGHIVRTPMPSCSENSATWHVSNPFVADVVQDLLQLQTQIYLFSRA